MTRLIVVSLIAVLLSATGAEAYSCEFVRGLAAIYSRAQLLAMAKRYGLTAAQVSEAAKCLSKR